MFIAIVKISIKAIKFDDITVTFHPTKPKKPIIIKTEKAVPLNKYVQKGRLKQIQTS